ncbi:MAG: class II aldolase/adducin family protein [Chloroflexi bacterium]|nr:class II aldolase/adducin family protein [Chloroflexota bacterium]
MSIGEQIIRVCIAFRKLGHLDLRGAVSVRLPEGQGVLVTPGYGPGVPPPAWLTPEDLVVADLEGRQLQGRWRPPRDLQLHLQLYAARPEINAIVFSQSRTALAFGAVERPLLPLTHEEASLASAGIPRFGSGELIATAEQGQALARALGERPVALLPGQGAVAVGAGLAEAAMRTHNLEGLARINAFIAPLGARFTVSPARAAYIDSQRHGSDAYLAYFESIASAAAAPPARPSDASNEDLRARLALASRLLYHRGLVQFLEHVSHRLPDGSGFLMTPAKHMGQMQPEDLATVDWEGRWVAGPLTPPPFRWYHRDLLRARPEVQAIVHTHQVYGRAYALADLQPLPLYRGSARVVRAPIPIYPVPDLIFDEEHRVGAVAALGAGSTVHELSHGIDYVSRDLAESTVAALQFEEACALDHLARALGAPQALSASVLDQLDAEEPSAEEWWQDYVSELPAAMRLAAQPGA